MRILNPHFKIEFQGVDPVFPKMDTSITHCFGKPCLDGFRNDFDLGGYAQLDLGIRLENGLCKPVETIHARKKHNVTQHTGLTEEPYNVSKAYKLISTDFNTEDIAL